MRIRVTLWSWDVVFGALTPNRGAGVMPWGHGGLTTLAEHPAEPDWGTPKPARAQVPTGFGVCRRDSGVSEGGHLCHPLTSPLLQQHPPSTHPGALLTPKNLPIHGSEQFKGLQLPPAAMGCSSTARGGCARWGRPRSPGAAAAGSAPQKLRGALGSRSRRCSWQNPDSSCPTALPGEPDVTLPGLGALVPQTEPL